MRCYFYFSPTALHVLLDILLTSNASKADRAHGSHGGAVQVPLRPRVNDETWMGHFYDDADYILVLRQPVADR